MWSHLRELAVLPTRQALTRDVALVTDVVPAITFVNVILYTATRHTLWNVDWIARWIIIHSNLTFVTL